MAIKAKTAKKATGTKQAEPKKVRVKKESPFAMSFNGMVKAGFTQKSPVYVGNDKISFARLVVNNKMWFSMDVLSGAQKYLS